MWRAEDGLVVQPGLDPAATYNITSVAGAGPGAANPASLSGSFGSTRPPRLLSVTVADADNGDEAYGYCDTLTFSFDMATDMANDPTIDMYSLFHFANPQVVGGVAQCDVPYHGECPAARSKRHPWRCSSSAPVPPQGAPGGSGRLGTPRVGARPLGAQPPPRGLALAASSVADFKGTAFGHLGPVYDATNSSSYTGAWLDDGARYVVQLACPAPEGTRTLADGNTYAGAVPRPYVFDPRRTTPKDAWNYTAGTTAAYSLLYYSSLPTPHFLLLTSYSSLTTTRGTARQARTTGRARPSGSTAPTTGRTWCAWRGSCWG